MTPVAAESPVSTAAGGEPSTTPTMVGRITPVAAESPVSTAAGGEPTITPTCPVPVHAAVPEAAFSAHFLEVSSRPSLPMTASAYAGLRGRTVSAGHLFLQRTDTHPADWAAEVKRGNVFWLHFDGVPTDMQDKTDLKGYGKWVRWQQRRGCFWSLALPRRSAWLSNSTVLSLAALPGRRRDPLDLSGKRARRAAEEHSALGGLRDAAVSVTKLAGWTNVGVRLNTALDYVLWRRGSELGTAVERIKGGFYMGPSLELAEELYLALCKEFAAGPSPAGTRGPHGPLLGAVLHAAGDPDTCVEDWLSSQTPLGITKPIPCTGVFPVLSSEDAVRAARKYAPADHAGGSTDNYTSYREFTVGRVIVRRATSMIGGQLHVL